VEKEARRIEQGRMQLVLYAQNEGNKWYIDSECSKQITRDHTKFLTLKEEKLGRVNFGDNFSTRIVGKCTISIDNGKTKTQNAMYFEGSKKNILSVSKMCDQGYNLTFHYKGCEIRKANSGILVANANRTSSGVYILNDVKEETCRMEKKLGVISISSH
jgi:hypothetical protein